MNKYSAPLILATATLFSTIFLPGCQSGSIGDLAPTVIPARSADASPEYLALLAQFPEDQQGLSHEFWWPDVQEQPMTFGLVLSAESLRYRASPTDEGKRRMRKAVEWLTANADADHDGRPGWGLPNAYDAFGDGSLNPPGTSYTITSSIVMDGLLDALQIPSLWSSTEREEMRKLLLEVAVRWCHDVWTPTPSGGYFWYSTEPVDAHFVANVSAMFLGTLARILTEQAEVLDGATHTLLIERMDEAAGSIVSTVGLRNHQPFWDYLPPPNSVNDIPNDLIHHVYVIWGMELYRASGGKIALSWTTLNAVQSLDTFWKAGSVYEFPQDVVYQGDRASFETMPSEVWGVGMMLAFYARWGNGSQVARSVDAATQSYGQFPLVHRWPPHFSSDATFYARFGAHVLWGLAIRDFAATAGP